MPISRSKGPVLGGHAHWRPRDLASQDVKFRLLPGKPAGSPPKIVTHYFAPQKQIDNPPVMATIIFADFDRKPI